MSGHGRSLVAPFVHVWSADPSLDREAEGCADAYAAFLDDRSPERIAALPVVPGGKLWAFECKPLSRRQHARIMDRWRAGEPNSAADDAVRCGLVSWRGFAGIDGATTEPKFRDLGGERVLSEGTMDQLYAELALELGMTILGASTLRPTRGPASR